MDTLIAPTSVRHLERPRPVVGRRFRPDIQALRAVAVLAVVLYHAKVPWVSGGYVGVDVFFVISGFLITGQLVREVQTRGRIALVDFYIKRVRRLLPPATLVVVVTLVAAVIWLPPLRVKALATDAIVTTFYGLNVRLALQGIDYQSGSAPPSALQHFWSLAVEEQYYLLWPTVILLVVWLARRRWRAALATLLVVVAAASVLESQRLVHDNAPLAYFSLQSRAWELALGALIAMSQLWLARLPGVLREAFVWTGLAGVGVAVARYTDTTPFPGWHALLPVLGSAAVIAGGCGRATSLEGLFSLWPVQRLGLWSYSWYLWHWPMVVIGPVALTGGELAWPWKLALMLAALVLAGATYEFVELPCRRVAPERSTWIAATGLMAASTVVTSLLVTLRSLAAMGLLVSVAASAAPGAASLSAPASKADPLAGTLTDTLTPSVTSALNDSPAYPAECIVEVRDSVSPHCLIGPDGKATSAPVTSARIVLLGDSHAGQWFAPIQAIAASHGWSTEVLTKAGCPLATVTVRNDLLHRNYTECDQWRRSTLQRLAGEPAPKLVFVGSLNRYAQGSALIQGWQQTLRALNAIGAPVVYLKDTPVPGVDIPTCLSETRSNWSRCTFRRTAALRGDPLNPSPPNGVRLAAVVDVNGYLCPGVDVDCPGVRGDILLYRDDSHVTSTAMTMLTPAIRYQLRAAGLPS